MTAEIAFTPSPLARCFVPGLTVQLGRPGGPDDLLGRVRRLLRRMWG